MSWDDVAITTYGDYGNFSVRGDRYRYIVYANGDEEFYDLQEDPNEMTSVYDDPKYADVVTELKAELKRLQDKYGDDGTVVQFNQPKKNRPKK